MGLSLFSVICFLHCLIALSIGTLMMFHIKDIYTFTHGIEATTKLLGSTPKDQLLIRTSESFSGLLLFAIGSLLFMVSFVKEREFQSFFAKGCVVLHLSMAIWRFHFERRVQFLLAWDWLRLIEVCYFKAGECGSAQDHDFVFSCQIIIPMDLQEDPRGQSATNLGRQLKRSPNNICLGQKGFH